MILGSLRSGINRTWTGKRMLVPFYLVNLVSGLLIMIPFAYALNDFAGTSMMRQKLGESMDYDFLFEFLYYADSGLSAVQGMIMTVPFLYWLIALFLSGGALTIFAKHEHYASPAFWGGAASYFGRILRLALLALPVLVALFCLRYLVNLFQLIFFGSDPYEYIVYWGAWIKMALGFIGLILFGLIFDYARIHLVLTDNRKTRKSLWQGARFAVKNLKYTLGLAFIIFLGGWSAIIVYYFGSNLFSAPGWLIVIVLFIWQQLYIVSKMAIRLTAYSSQMELFRKASI